jgi:orotate phosphoribosyltransferase
VNTEEIMHLYRETGVLLEGHFLLTSGRHSGQFLQCSQIMQWPHLAERLAREIGARFSGERIDGVVGPALGGIILAYEVARALGVRGVYAEKENGRMTLRRGFFVRKGERFLCVEDALTTGASVRMIMDVVRESGGVVAGVGVLSDRSGGQVDLGARLEALTTLSVDSFAPEDCPLCRAGLPLTKPKSAAR